MGVRAVIDAWVPYLVFVMLFGIGSYLVVADPNLIKKVIGLNFMQVSVYLFFVIAGYRAGAVPPLVGEAGPHANPLPHAIVLTAIVVGVSITAMALALLVRLYDEFGAIDVREIETALAEDGEDK